MNIEIDLYNLVETLIPKKGISVLFYPVDINEENPKIFFYEDQKQFDGDWIFVTSYYPGKHVYPKNTTSKERYVRCELGGEEHYLDTGCLYLYIDGERD